MKLMFFSYVIFLFYSFHKHLLVALMGLEIMMLGLFIMLFYNYMILMINLWILIYFLIFMVCDAVLGLSLLLMILRYYSNDLMKSMSLNLW